MRRIDLLDRPRVGVGVATSLTHIKMPISFCPVPHRTSDQIWIFVGATVGFATARFLYRKAKSLSSSRAASQCFTVVLTGGPCGGKSSSLSTISSAARSKGFNVFVVPEVPTMLISGGCVYPGVDGGRKLLEYEKGLIELQLQIEESFLRIAASTRQPSVIIMDRGLLDVPAYLPPGQWRQVLRDNALTERQLAARYDLVVHLNSAADGAEQFYTIANNQARTETAEEARELDAKIVANWRRAHPNVVVIDNSSIASFDQKCARACEAVMRSVEANLSS
jgi:predicted ATPase